jgi:hypothetical protein
MPKPSQRKKKSGAAKPKPAVKQSAAFDYEPTEAEALRLLGDWRPNPAGEAKPQKSDAEPADLLSLLKNTRVFFYPACLHDWRPLFRFSLADRFDCRTFVYCDWLHDLDGSFDREISRIGRNPPPGHELHRESVREIQPHELTGAGVAAPISFLHLDEATDYRERFEQFATPVGWGRLVKLRHVLHGRQRELNLVYLGAEGVATYLQVFRAQQIAPLILCTVNCGVGFGCGWTDFRIYDGPLGRAVGSIPAKPEFVVNEGHAPYDWPWNEAVQDFGDMKVYRRPGDTLKTGGEQPPEDRNEAACSPEQSKLPKKYPNPFKRRIPHGSRPGPLPKPKSGFGFYGTK